jgi:hypothetical protein
MMTLLHFCIKVMLPAPETPKMTARLSAPPTINVLHLDLGTNDPATLSKLGSFNYDQDSGQYPLEWADINKFDVWCQSEELAYSIELICSTVAHGRMLWSK